MMSASRHFLLTMLLSASGLVLYAGCGGDDTSAPAADTAGADASVAPTPTTPPADAGPRTCSGTKTLCSDNCVDTTLDRENCGGCGKGCGPSEVCSQGQCGLSCGGGTTKCGNDCADTATDEKNCGACGKACGAGQTCQDSKCGCPAGLTPSGDTCVDLQVDDKNCGTPGKVCAADAPCMAGTCKGPISAWLFEDNLDDVTAKNNGTLAEGTETYEAPSYSTTAGKAFHFDGSTSISVAAPTALPLGSTPRTIEAWVRAAAFADSTYNGILSYGVRACNGKGQLLSLRNNFGVTSANWCNDLTATPAGVPRAQAWSHVAYVWDGTQRKLFVDGTLVSSDVPAPFNTEDGELRIGSTDTPGRRFNGWIDDVKIYDYAWTPAQLKKIVSDQSIAYAFTAATDMTDSGPMKLSAGTKAGGVSATADRKNAANAALAFDGVDGTQVQIFPASALGKSRPYTIGVWVKANAAAQGTIVHNSSAMNGGGWCLPVLGLDATGKPTAVTWNGGNITVAADDPIVAGTWTHLATSVSGDTVNLYVNGVLKKSAAVPGGYSASNAPNYVTLGTSLGTGCSGTATVGGNFAGAIDDFKVWDRELSATEIANEAK